MIYSATLVNLVHNPVNHATHACIGNLRRGTRVIEIANSAVDCKTEMFILLRYLLSIDDHEVGAMDDETFTTRSFRT